MGYSDFLISLGKLVSHRICLKNSREASLNLLLFNVCLVLLISYTAKSEQTLVCEDFVRKNHKIMPPSLVHLLFLLSRSVPISSTLLLISAFHGPLAEQPYLSLFVGWLVGCPAMVTPVQISLLVAPHPKTHTFSESL